MEEGDKVKRVKPRSDYTYGRTGVILEIKSGRARVSWEKDSAGFTLTPVIRTWVSIRNLEKLQNAES